MKKELEQELINIAPYMFRYKGWNDPKKSLICFGFACGDGWFNLLKNLITELKQLDVNKEIRIMQVKEKYGSLRFYESELPEYLFSDFYKILLKYEKQSEETCEKCGGSGKIIGTTWLKCLCKTCTEELNYAY
jgi:hypothetical protein